VAQERAETTAEFLSKNLALESVASEDQIEDDPLWEARLLFDQAESLQKATNQIRGEAAAELIFAKQQALNPKPDIDYASQREEAERFKLEAEERADRANTVKSAASKVLAEAEQAKKGPEQKLELAKNRCREEGLSNESKAQLVAATREFNAAESVRLDAENAKKAADAECVAAGKELIAAIAKKQSLVSAEDKPAVPIAEAQRLLDKVAKAQENAGTAFDESQLSNQATSSELMAVEMMPQSPNSQEQLAIAAQKLKDAALSGLLLARLAKQAAQRELDAVQQLRNAQPSAEIFQTTSLGAETADSVLQQAQQMCGESSH